ncbi:hypothetical protein N658DRAFT_497202 [Parathielavia hyrcaniae]|uniref:Secreted protein n=1 Tax=Parathielavia hyrcaniae TaxID=113614 RepID=A0AAN6PYT6_9PEZI|nr:hypothetical protein N658DRAFT_497202 [Parathielavia hyrcaniae]
MTALSRLGIGLCGVQALELPICTQSIRTPPPDLSFDLGHGSTSAGWSTRHGGQESCGPRPGRARVEVYGSIEDKRFAYSVLPGASNKNSTSRPP